MKWFKSKNNQTLNMENFCQITWVQPSTIMSSMKPETYQRRDPIKNKKLLTSDRLNSNSEPMNKHLNQVSINFVLQLHKILVAIRNSNNSNLMTENIATWTEEKLKCNQLRIKMDYKTFPLATNNSSNLINS